MMKRRLCLLLAAGLIGSGEVRAIVGGAPDDGALSRASVMVLSSKGGVCSAVVLAPDVVLTAAHCVTGADQYRVHFRDEANEPVLIAPQTIAVHPGYDAKAIEKRTRSIDLALVRLPESLPARFDAAPLTAVRPTKGDPVTVAGYGLSQEGVAKTTGTFRSAALSVVEPYGPSQILLWTDGKGAIGACQGDSGGPMASGDVVVAITSWSAGTKTAKCGGTTQGILVGPQRSWIDRVAAGWQRHAQWRAN
ncbi:S1 family peptidase [Microvirga antarctica]|uniref:S1 family peptidase n=1 Tax=Microvirga antarctica TaxID=2819233 RepID=UPI001FE99A1A|nr:trypsin-like serine protease [Microvirga antarctica]